MRRRQTAAYCGQRPPYDSQFIRAAGHASKRGSITPAIPWFPSLPMTGLARVKGPLSTSLGPWHSQTRFKALMHKALLHKAPTHASLLKALLTPCYTAFVTLLIMWPSLVSPIPSDALVAIELLAVDRHGVAETLQHDETRVVPNTVNPKWNAIFDFVVPEALVDDAMVVFKAWDTRGIGRAFLGQVRPPF